MKRRRSIAVLAAFGCIVILLTRCMPILPEPDLDPYVAPFNPAEIEVDPVTGAEVVSTQVLVRFKSSVSNSRREEIIRSLDCSTIGAIPFLDIYQLLLPDGIAPRTMAEQISNLAEVIWSEPSYLVELDESTFSIHSRAKSIIVSDSKFGNQWALHNTGQSGGTVDCDLDAPEAWRIEDGIPGICIAILDTGVNYQHEDLSYSLRMPDGIDFDVISGDDCAPLDEHGHGTAMTGVAVARRNGVGVVGIAPQASFLPVRVLGNTPLNPQLNVAIGIYLAALADARIISMSLSYDYVSNALRDMVNWIAADNEILLVGSAGNYGESAIRFPSGLSNVLCVGATDHNDNRSAWRSKRKPGSNFGSHVDISAPGGSGIGSDQSMVQSTHIDGGYDWTGGTSSATAYVAGVAALVWSLDKRSDNDYDLAASDIREVIADTADPIPVLEMGSGRVNACRALLEALRRLDIEETHKPFYVESSNDLYMLVGVRGDSDTHLGKLRTAGGITPDVTDIAWDDSKCALYATSFDQLYQIDPVSIALHPIGTGLGSSDVNALAADAKGSLYALTVDGELLRVNASSGIASHVGELGTGITGSGDLAFSPDGLLYGSVRFVGSTDDELVEVDISDGRARSIGSIGYDAVFGLFFVGENLYGVTADSELIAINTSTGNGAFVRDLSFSAWGAQDFGNQ